MRTRYSVRRAHSCSRPGWGPPVSGSVKLGDQLGDEPPPFDGPPGVVVEDAQALHGADDEVVPAVGEGQAAGVQQVGLLRPQHAGDLGMTLPVLVVVVVAELAGGGGPGAGGVEGGGAAVRAVVLLEEGVQVPGDGGVDGVVPAAVGGEQADFGGPVQQRDPRLAVQPGDRGHRAARHVRAAHRYQGVDVGEALEQGAGGRGWRVRRG